MAAGGGSRYSLIPLMLQSRLLLVLLLLKLVLREVVLDLIMLVKLLLLLLLLLVVTSMRVKSRSLSHDFAILLSLFILVRLHILLLLNWVWETRGTHEILKMLLGIKVGRALRQI
jgi:hypothetical protein